MRLAWRAPHGTIPRRCGRAVSCTKTIACQRTQEVAKIVTVTPGTTLDLTAGAACDGYSVAAGRAAGFVSLAFMLLARFSFGGSLHLHRTKVQPRDSALRHDVVLGADCQLSGEPLVAPGAGAARHRVAVETIDFDSRHNRQPKLSQSTRSRFRAIDSGEYQP